MSPETQIIGYDEGAGNLGNITRAIVSASRDVEQWIDRVIDALWSLRQWLEFENQQEAGRYEREQGK